jgi:hypothetical protein
MEFDRRYIKTDFEAALASVVLVELEQVDTARSI